ncbi:MAG: hypothetical protein VX498_01875 [Myxococcota bacterium]|nr:hypothetical protein [Myxococcota bacterium]
MARRSSLLCLLLVFGLAPPASAAGEAVQLRTHEGQVLGEVLVDAPAAAARRLLGNPDRVARVEGRGAEISSRKRGDCTESTIVAPSGVGKISYTSLSCPTETGFEGSLVSSKQIRTLKARWTIEERGEQTLLKYELYAVPRIRVPQKLVALLAKRGVGRLLGAVRDELEQEAQQATPR